jgi:hypothetical protein
LCSFVELGEKRKAAFRFCFESLRSVGRSVVVSTFAKYKMDKYFEQSETAEGQQNAEAILYIHCAHKGMQFGAGLGTVLGVLIHLFGFRPGSRPISTLSNIGAMTGPLASMGLCYGKMRGKDKIEWQDRAWRLQRNQRQNTVDQFSEGALLGGLLMARKYVGVSIALSTIGAFAMNEYQARVAK